MTMLRIVNIFLLIFVALLVIMLIYGNYVIAIGVFIFVIIFYNQWHSLLRQELVVYDVCKNGGSISYQELTKKHKNIDLIIKRLMKKGIIKHSEGNIVMLKKEYRFSMTKYKYSKKK